MSNFIPTIGIEVHVVVDSKTKMFSPSRSSHSGEFNTQINEIDLGLPGVLPSPNKRVVEKAMALAKSFHMEIDKNIRFDRKNYFYQDLPKGYQITQQFFPIGKDGYLEIQFDDGSTKKIEIERIHMEEDTAKQFKREDGLFMDFNRAGMPLIEIVTKPCISSPLEAELFLKELRKTLQFNQISDAKMEEGSMRADINISLAPVGSNTYGVRTEVKNVNSISNVGKAIEFEIQRKFELIVSGSEQIIDTRRFDDSKMITVFMREKTSNVDYRYMTEPNILNIQLDDAFVNNAIAIYYVDYKELEKELTKYIDDQSVLKHIFSEYSFYKKFTDLVDLVKGLYSENFNIYLEAYKWLFIEYSGIISKDNLSVVDVSKHDIQAIASLIELLASESINGKQAKSLLKEIHTNKDETVEEMVKRLGYKQINDKDEIMSYILKYQDNEIINELAERPEKVEKFFIGKIMKDTNGQANPSITKIVYEEFIKGLKK